MTVAVKERPVRAFACRVNGTDWGETIYNDTSAGRSRYRHWRMVREPWPDVKLMDISVRLVGAPRTSEAFQRNAAYRGMPYVRCGQRVTVNGAHGSIIGHNSSANFDVLFDADSRYGAQVLNVHPSDVTLDGTASARERTDYDAQHHAQTAYRTRRQGKAAGDLFDDFPNPRPAVQEDA